MRLVEQVLPQNQSARIRALYSVMHERGHGLRAEPENVQFVLVCLLLEMLWQAKHHGC